MYRENSGWRRGRATRVVFRGCKVGNRNLRNMLFQRLIHKSKNSFISNNCDSAASFAGITEVWMETYTRYRSL